MIVLVSSAIAASPRKGRNECCYECRQAKLRYEKEATPEMIAHAAG